MSQNLTELLSTVRLPGVVVMLIHSRLIAGTKKATPEEIELALGAKFTQDAVYTNGSIRVLPKDSVDTMTEHKRRLEALLKKEGFAFAGGYAIAEEKADEVYADAMRICAAFNASRQTLSVDVLEVTKAYAATQPKWEQIIIARGYTQDDVGACTLHLMPMRVELSREAFAGAGPLLAAYSEEVAGEAQDWLDDLAKRGTANRKALSPIKRWAEKAAGYADASLKSLSHKLCGFLNSFPGKGNVEGELLYRLKELYEQLATVEGVIQYANAEDALNLFKAPVAPLAQTDSATQVATPQAHAKEQAVVYEEVTDPLAALAQGARPQVMTDREVKLPAPTTQTSVEVPAADQAASFFLEVA